MKTWLEVAGITYGVVVLIDGEDQAVVGILRDLVEGDLIPVVRTGGDRTVEQIALDRLTRVKHPRGIGTCAKCGAVYKVHGDRTSHCGSCCETLEGQAVWDVHRVMTADGKGVCRPLASLSLKKVRLRKVADPVPGLVTTGSWRGPKLDGRVFSA